MPPQRFQTPNRALPLLVFCDASHQGHLRSAVVLPTAFAQTQPFSRIRQFGHQHAEAKEGTSISEHEAAATTWGVLQGAGKQQH